MKTVKATLTAIALLASTSVFANDTVSTEAQMQHYIFKYDMHNGVDPVTYQYKETRQDIRYQVVLDVQQRVYGYLNNFADEGTSENTFMAMNNYSAEDKAE